MKEPGLDNRHRDKNGEISRKHGNTLVKLCASNMEPPSRRASKTLTSCRTSSLN